MDAARHPRMLLVDADRLLHEAFHDATTGLPNRELLLDRVARSAAIAERHRDYTFAVLFLDVDRFRHLNDTMGHGGADDLLAALARRLEGCLHPGETVARTGGDEFALLLDDIHDGLRATRVAHRVRAALSAPFRVGGHEVFVSASLGLALYQPGRPACDLLRDAHTAMHRAKAAGTGVEVFDEGMHEKAVTRLRLENDLRRALERGELAIQYQPIVSLGSGAMRGVEALVRWNHPGRGLLSPSEFIPLAEETGTAGAIGTWMIRTACRQVATWQRRFPSTPPLRVGVNAYSRQFVEPGLAGKVDEAIREAGLAQGSLVLEITESVLMEGSDAVQESLRQLREDGVRLAIDDFGTGYSAMSYLHQLPLDTLKIDRSFVTQLEEDPKKRAIARAIVGLAHTVGLEVVGEGVETPEQRAALHEMGCEYAQGFLFSRPLEPAGIEEILESGRRW